MFLSFPMTFLWFPMIVLLFSYDILMISCYFPMIIAMGGYRFLAYFCYLSRCVAKLRLLCQAQGNAKVLRSVSVVCITRYPKKQIDQETWGK